jgi:CrcB protein
VISVLIIIRVACEGVIGAVMRYGFIHVTYSLIKTAFQLGTFLVNILGSGLMGLLVIILLEKGQSKLTACLLAGVLGGFTTFSTFSIYTITLAQKGELLLACSYVILTVLLSLLSLILFMILGKLILQ